MGGFTVPKSNSNIRANCVLHSLRIFLRSATPSCREDGIWELDIWTKVDDNTQPRCPRVDYAVVQS
jgi:hypothetical protein